MTATNSFAELMKEHFAFQKEQQEKRSKRIADTVRKDPHLSLWQLVERFGGNSQTIMRVLNAAGLKLSSDHLTYRETVRSGGVPGTPWVGRRRRTG